MRNNRANSCLANKNEQNEQTDIYYYKMRVKDGFLVKISIIY